MQQTAFLRGQCVGIAVNIDSRKKKEQHQDILNSIYSTCLDQLTRVDL
jgi:hypothetical protein